MKKKRGITVLGSTGSIGVQALDVVRSTGCAEVVALACGGSEADMRIFGEQIAEFKPRFVAVADYAAAFELERSLKKEGVKTSVLAGADGVIAAAEAEEAETVLNAIVGAAGLLPTEAAIKAGKNIALANKETLVIAGEYITKLAKEYNIKIIPVDSEHSAIFQCLNGEDERAVERIYLTASGGPFRGWTREQMCSVTLEQALKHPNWSMGAKITIDSATMMNKGLEFIEAVRLFSVEPEKIEVLVHPQSIIHSMVEFCDGAVMAQLGTPDMRTPIQYALTYPERVSNNFGRLKMSSLSFEGLDNENFPSLNYAKEALRIGGTMPAVMNAANETAVERFLNREIGFTQIFELINITMSAYNKINKNGQISVTVEDILEADGWAREFAKTTTGL